MSLHNESGVIKMNNVCLSLSLNYTANFLAPFIKSFEKHATGRLYIITDNVSNIKKSEKVIPIAINEVIKKYNVSTSLTPFNLKPILFYLILKELKDVKEVLISDIDVIFQDDPFRETEFKHSELVICEEKKKFKDCEVNLAWLKINYPEYVEMLLDNQILNSGVVYGSKAAVQNYLKQMAYEMQNVVARNNYPILDQIILNILFYIKKTVTPELLQHNNGFIVHLSQVDKDLLTNEAIKSDGSFILYNVKNTIVHQYNKHAILNNFYLKYYGK